MPSEDLTALLARARAVLEHYMFEQDGETIRDDVAAVCMAIDDALPQGVLLELPPELSAV